MDAQEVIGILLPLTAICSYVNYKFIRLPKSIGITLVALLITVIVNVLSHYYTPINVFAQNLVDNIGFKETFLHGMLSFLLFAGALHLNSAELSKQKWIIAAFATISVLISTVLIGYATYGLTLLVGVKLPLYYCFVFGALISPTDAITVISVLKTLNVPKALQIKIEGEALFNDGMGIALFFMAIALAYGEEQSIESAKAIIYFFREAGGGLILGALMGLTAAKLFSTIDESEIAIILTLALVTGGYVLATSVLDVSGPICMATTGLIVGNSFNTDGESKASIKRVEEFWDLLDQLLNAILFVLIGLEFIRIQVKLPICIASMFIIGATILARYISVLIPVTCFSKFKSYNRAMMYLMTWGGLRGGISIALALSIIGPYRDDILTITYFVVLFSIIVQGLTMRPLVVKLIAKESLETTHGTNKF
jgi:CPA1 family monovalent cation:H+ antiporter